MPSDPSPSPDVPEAMVEAGAEALFSRGGRWSGWELDMPENYREQVRDDARRVLTAALRLDDPETVERVKRALMHDGGYETADPVDAELAAKAAISALLNTTDDESPDIDVSRLMPPSGVYGEPGTDEEEAGERG